MVFIPKAERKNYTIAISYRSISLTSFLLKMEEKFINKNLTENIQIKFSVGTSTPKIMDTAKS